MASIDFSFDGCTVVNDSARRDLLVVDTERTSSFISPLFTSMVMRSVTGFLAYTAGNTAMTNAFRRVFFVQQLNRKINIVLE